MAGGIEQDLNPKAFGKAGNGRPAGLNGVEEVGRKPGNRRDPAIGGKLEVHGIVDFDRAQRRFLDAGRRAIRNLACNPRVTLTSVSVPSSP